MNDRIQSKSDLKNFIDADLKSLGIEKISIKQKLKALFIPQIWKYEILLRKLEYYINSNKKIMMAFYNIRLKRYGLKLGGVYDSTKYFWTWIVLMPHWNNYY